MIQNLLPLSTRLSDICKEYNIGRHIIEKDYLLSWVLVGISKVPELKEHLIFKGGTCLKKCYFGDYRFSEDLDFTAIGKYPKGKDLEQLVNKAIKIAHEELSNYEENSALINERYIENKPHPKNQEAFIIRARFSYQREALVRALLEVTTDEKMLTLPIEKKIIHIYGEGINNTIQCYSLEEIIAEKTSAILANTMKVHEKTWIRSRARDYYDLWRIFKDFHLEVQKSDLRTLIEKKCLSKKLKFSSLDDLFDQHYISQIKETWQIWLGPLVPNLPESDEVL